MASTYRMVAVTVHGPSRQWNRRRQPDGFDALRRLAGALTVVLLAVACGTSMLPASATPIGDEWVTYRGDLSRDGHPPAATLDAAAARRLELAWRVDVGAAVDGSPAVAGSIVIVATEAGGLFALNRTTGAPIWSVSGLGSFSSSPTIAGNVVLAGSLSGDLYAIELSRGVQLWAWHAPGDKPALWSSPSVSGGLVLVGIGSQYGDIPLEAGRIVALDLATGREIWAICVETACAPGGGVWSTPAVDAGGRAFVGTGNPDDGVLAFDTATGRRLWSMSFYADEGRDLDVGQSPVLLRTSGREVVAVGSVAGVFKLLDAINGAVLWSDNLVSGSPVHGLIASPAYDGTSLFVPSASPPTGMFALDPTSGVVRWRHSTDQPVYSAPAAGNGALVFGTGAVLGKNHVGSLVALSSADGRVLWSYDTHSAVYSAPAMAGSMIVVGDTRGDVFAFTPQAMSFHAPGMK